ncbi:MAG: hypothetical protein U0556_16360 [Dehalococcoidia bacterium]
MTRRPGDERITMLGTVAVLVMVGLQALYSASFALAMSSTTTRVFVVRQVLPSRRS